MKNHLYLLFSITLFVSACEETPPAIDFSAPIVALKDTTFIAASVPAPQHKAVLLEDITGVRCVNCPTAAKKANDIVTLKSEDSVVVIAIYPIDLMNNFTYPYPNVPQLASQLSKQIVEHVSTPGSLPNGYVDRNKFAGKTDRVIGYNEWINYVNERLRVSTPVNITLGKAISGRKVTVDMKLEYNTLAASGKQHSFCLYLIESGIVSTQLDGSGPNENYVHNHALRYSFGLPVGNPLLSSSIAGRTYIKQFAYDIPNDYIIGNCRLVCVVLDDVTGEVVNVREIHL